MISEVLAELSRDLELKSSEVTTKQTRHLGRTLVKTAEEVVESMLGLFNMSALRSSPTLKWERRETDEKEMLASADNLLENCCGLTEWTCVVRWRKRHQALDVRATWT